MLVLFLTTHCMFQPLFDSEAIGIFALLDDAVVGGEDIDWRR